MMILLLLLLLRYLRCFAAPLQFSREKARLTMAIMHRHEHRTILLLLLLLTAATTTAPVTTALECRSACGSIPIRYPFGVDDGCGAPQFRQMLMCNTTSNGALYFVTPNGNYKVQAIDYDKHTVAVYDPDMSTCAILQPHHDLVMTDIQYAVIPPSPDTVFALMNCSVDSPVLNRYRSLCFNFSGHSCDELYTCNSFKTFNMPPTTTTPTPNSTTALIGAPPAISSPTSTPTTLQPPPPCCFTGYSTLKFMSMDILDCTHYTSIYDTDDLKGVGPMDWTYGIKFSFAVPDTGCDRCSHSGGTCGFDTATEGLLCLCSGAGANATRECAAGTGGGLASGGRRVHRHRRGRRVHRHGRGGSTVLILSAAAMVGFFILFL